MAGKRELDAPCLWISSAQRNQQSSNRTRSRRRLGCQKTPLLLCLDQKSPPRFGKSTKRETEGVPTPPPLRAKHKASLEHQDMLIGSTTYSLRPLLLLKAGVRHKTEPRADVYFRLLLMFLLWSDRWPREYRDDRWHRGYKGPKEHWKTIQPREHEKLRASDACKHTSTQGAELGELAWWPGSFSHPLKELENIKDSCCGTVQSPFFSPTEKSL